MRVYVVSFALGVWLLQRQAELPPLDWAWGLLALAPALALCRARARPVRHAGHAMLALCAFGAGFMWAAGMAHVRLADELPREWEARDIELIGVVASLPQPSDRSVRFDFDVEDVLTPSARVPRHVALSWWAREGALPDVRAWASLIVGRQLVGGDRRCQREWP